MQSEDQLAVLIREAERRSGKTANEKKEKTRWRDHWERNTGPRRNQEVHRPVRRRGDA